MDSEIEELDAETRDRIAAGEVVERPASVVKELVENSLDADADRIEVAVEAGGTDRIVVSDDGIGMDETDVRRAIEEHTTSKLRSVDDLDSIGTLGFRGEALHAIGSVARLRIETRPRGGSRGTELIVEGGEVRSCGPTGCPPGTTVEVSELFGNVPARRKYLKTEATEFDHVARIVTGYALARPEVALSLSRDGRETFATPGDGDRRSAVMAVYGRDVASAMLPVDADGEGPLDGVEGLVSHPETNRAGSEYVTTLVDGRYVTSSTVREAIVDAYGRHLAGDRYPFAVIDLDLPPGQVDVNVHPRKLEVIYKEPEAIKRQVRTVVEDALREEGLLRSSAPRGRSAPEQTRIDPSSTGEGTADSTEERADDETGETVVDTDTDGAETEPAETSEPTPEGSPSRTSPDAEPTRSTSGASAASSSEDPIRRPSNSGQTADPASDSSPHSRRTRSPVAGSDTQTSLSGDEAHAKTGYETLPDLRVLGQLHDTYIVAEADDGLLLIDQHAADERINYERLKERFEGDTTTQALAEPVEVELTSREAALFDTYREALARLGFYATLGEDAVEVTTVPALVAESAGPSAIRDVLADLVEGEDAAEETVEAIADELLSDMACHPSITGNTSLTDGSVVDLLSRLDGCEDPWTCPHGRPVLISIDSGEIDDRFERDYPGHVEHRE